MKQPIKILSALALAVAGFLAPAQALTIGDANYLGSASPGLPSGEGNEEDYIDQLVSMAINTTFGTSPGSTGDNYFVRSGNAFANLPAADFIDKPAFPNYEVSVTGFVYLLAKFGKAKDAQISHIWYVGNLSGNVSVPSGTSSTANNLSHVSRFNRTSVPDGASTLALLGLGLVALAGARFRFARS
jgi:hypothetical protein